MKGRTAVRALAGMTLLGLATLSACTNDAELEPSDSDPAGAVIRELAAKHDAITGWEEDLVFTLDAQERLTSGRPVLFRGYVDDMFHRNGETFVRFWSDYRLLAGSLFVFELRCSQPIVETLAQRSSGSVYLDFFGEYAVVANIEEVAKAVLTLGASALSEDDAEIDMYPSGLFTAKGTCTDIAYIGAD